MARRQIRTYSAGKISKYVLIKHCSLWNGGVVYPCKILVWQETILPDVTFQKAYFWSEFIYQVKVISREKEKITSLSHFKFRRPGCEISMFIMAFCIWLTAHLAKEEFLLFRSNFNAWMLFSLPRFSKGCLLCHHILCTFAQCLNLKFSEPFR